MRTKVSAFCSKLIEAGWLLALAIVPLFFNVYSSRVFEPDKLSLLRSIALIMAAAWAVRWTEDLLAGHHATPDGEQGSAIDRFLKTPLAAPTALLVVVYILATITSVVPRVSFWGSYQRLQGTYSTLSYLVIFALIAQDLRRPEQLRRIVTTAILTSLPISVYGLLQHFQVDPLPWGGDVVFRVASNMGNAIFVGAYLILVIPLTLARIIHLVTEPVEKPGTSSRLAHLGLLTCYVVTLSAQLLCIFFSQSRGPWLGLLAGLFLFALLYVFQRGWRWLTLTVAGLAILIIVALGILNMPNTPFAKVRDLPYIGRIGSVFETESGTGKVRVLIWGGAAKLLVANPLRSVIGYGPESMWVVYNPYYPAELAHIESRNASPDRSHNETFDVLINTGIIGLIVYMSLMLTLFLHVFRWLGLMRNATQRSLFLAVGIASPILGALAGFLLNPSGQYVGVGLPLGFVAGLFLYVIIASILNAPRSKEEGATVKPAVTGWHLLLMMGLISAIVAHYVEINLGIAIAATRTYYWAWLAVIIVLGQGMIGAKAEAAVEAGHSEAARARSARKEPSTRAEPQRGKGGKRRPGPSIPSWASESRRRDEPARTQVLVLAVIVGLLLATLAWDYTINPQALTNPVAVAIGSLTTMAAKGHPEVVSLGLAGLVVIVFLIGLVLALSEVAIQGTEAHDSTWWLSTAGLFGAVALGTGVIYGLLHAARLGPGLDPGTLPYDYYVLTLVLWLALIWALGRGLPSPSSWVTGGWAFLRVPLLAVVCLVIIDSANISIVRADVYYKQGLKFEQDGRFDYAVSFYKKALEVTPNEDFYDLFEGRALMELAKQQQDAKQRDAYFTEALTPLEKARQLNPLNTDHTANLGRLYRTWAEYDQDPSSKKNKLDRAAQYYQEATTLSPHNAQLFNEWGVVYYLMGDTEVASAKYAQSLALDQQFLQTYILLGDLHLAKKEWDQAIAIYEKAVALDDTYIQGWSAMAYCYAQQSQWDKAIEANQKVLQYAPEDFATLKNLAIIYNQANRPADALPYAERALKAASEQDKASVQSFIQQLHDAIGKEKPQ